MNVFNNLVCLISVHWLHISPEKMPLAKMHTHDCGPASAETDAGILLYKLIIPISTLTLTQNSDTDKPRDAFMQIQWRG